MKGIRIRTISMIHQLHKILVVENLMIIKFSDFLFRFVLLIVNLRD